MKTRALVVVLLLAAPAPTQTTLAWKFAKGQAFEAERVATQKQSVALNGKTFKRSSESAWRVRLQVKEPDASDFVIHATLAKVEQKIDGAQAAELVDPKLHEKMQGSVFTLTVTPSGTIKHLAGYEDFLKRLAGADKPLLGALRGTFPEAAVKDALADLFGPLPQHAVKPGDRWKREFVEPIPHFGALRCTAAFVFGGGANERARIDYAIQTKYEIPQKDAPGLFRVAGGGIDSDKAGGAIVFDHAAGRLVEHQRTMRLRGKLTIDALDRRQEIEFASENRVKITIR